MRRRVSFPNTGVLGVAHVDVVALRSVPTPRWGNQYPMAGVRGCIHGEGEAPTGYRLSKDAAEKVLEAAARDDGVASAANARFTGKTPWLTPGNVDLLCA